MNRAPDTSLSAGKLRRLFGKDRDALAVWLSVAGFAAAIALSVVVFFATWRSMFLTWISIDTYTYGIIVPIISGWLVWRSRKRLRGLRPRSSPLGLAALVAACLLWVAGEISGVLVVQHVAVVGMVSAIALAMFGPGIMRVLAFPALFLFFSVPVGEFLIPVLIRWTADFAVRAVDFTGVPVVRDGPFIRIPTGDFHVVKACSGIRYLLTTVVLGTLFAHLSYRSIWRKLAFLGLCVVIPVAANWLRATGIILLAHVSDMRLAAGVDHLIYGLVFFGFVIAIVFLIGNRFADKPISGTLPGEADSAPGSRRGSGAMSQLIMLALVTGVVVGLPRVGPSAVSSGAGADSGVKEIYLPRPIAPWSGKDVSSAGWTPQYPTADSVARLDFADAGTVVSMLVAHYQRQSQGAELVSAENDLFGTGGWYVDFDRRHEWRTASGDEVIELRETGVTDGQRHRLIWSWYEIAGTRYVYDFSAKFATLVSVVTGKGSAATIVALASGYTADPDVARAGLGRFLEAHHARISRCVAMEPSGDSECRASAAPVF